MCLLQLFILANDAEKIDGDIVEAIIKVTAVVLLRKVPDLMTLLV